jgi:hypothetical protein
LFFNKIAFAVVDNKKISVAGWDLVRNTPWTTHGLEEDLKAEVSAAHLSVSGDYNGNGTVDAADYTVWRDHLGSASSLPNDDTLGVGPDDYDGWKANFGQSAGGESSTLESATVPESATMVLLMFAAAGWCLGHRRP